MPAGVIGTYKVSGGLHGVGVSCVNALSTHMTTQVFRNGKIYQQEYECGHPLYPVKEIGTSDITGTRQQFWPDNTIFTETVYNYEILATRMRELAYLNAGIKITLTDLRVKDGFNIEYVAIMSILIGFVDLLPLFGAGFIMVPWTVVLLIQGNAPAGIAVFVLWLVWSVIKQFLEPKFVSKQMGMHPIFTLLGMYTGFKLFGVIGLLLGPIIFLVIREVFANNVNKGILKDFFELE